MENFKEASENEHLLFETVNVKVKFKKNYLISGVPSSSSTLFLESYS